MAFTTQVFLFLFFPACFAGYFLVEALKKCGALGRFLEKIRLSDLALLGISCAFYMWACFDDVLWLLGYILVVWLLGIAIQRSRKSGAALLLTSEDAPEKTRTFPIAAVILTAAVLLVTYVLIHFKYTGLLAQVWNFFFKDSLKGKSILAPLGISFITFSAISYLADIYQGKAAPGSLLDCALYLSFFPKVVSGPIVLWRDFHSQIRQRRISLELVSDGVSRVMVGFAKKLILADTFGACIASISGGMDSATAFGVGLLYMLQIYFDFSGYSDIALGLANMLGFRFRENFDFPYLSRSITEFWRRWHISLGTWFREYIYFPLGGSRKGSGRTIINIGIVFLLTGIWHGAGWTYMLWGIINGLCNIAEKLLADNPLYRKTPGVVKWALTMCVTFFCWELFRAESFGQFRDWLFTMLGLIRFDAIPYTWQYYFDAKMITLMLVGILGATVFGLPRVQALWQRIGNTRWGYLGQQLLYVVLFVLAVMFMVNSKYSPFIYFQY